MFFASELITLFYDDWHLASDVSAHVAMFFAAARHAGALQYHVEAVAHPASFDRSARAAGT